MFCCCLILLLSNAIAVSASRYEFVLRPMGDDLNEGYVELKVNGTWGVMSSYYSPMDETTSRMLCKTLGFGSIGFSTYSRVELKLPNHVLLWDKLIKCDGNENNATECFKSIWQNTYHWVTALPRGWTRLHCFPFVVKDVRLFGGVLPHEGRLEFKVGNRWGAVCSYQRLHFGIFPSGNSICSILGYVQDSEPFKLYPEFVDEIQSPTEVWVSELWCANNVTNINECSLTPISGDTCGDHVLVNMSCQPAQVVNGSTQNTGIIEAGLFGQRQMICGSAGFSFEAANVTCNVLGYRSVGRFLKVDAPSGYSVAVFNGSINCNGTELSLELCDIERDLDQSGCLDSTVMYIECLGGPIDIIPIGNKSNEGIFTMNNWGMVWVVGARFSESTSKSLCKLLGHKFEGTSKHVYSLPRNVLLDDYPAMEYIFCFGNETDIAQCQREFSVSCGRCLYGVAGGFGLLYCAECLPGYFGTRCTECNCNNRSTAPCDIETGECTCQNGWYGTSCEYDIDECVTTTCPNNSDCTNSPGSYECICRQGYVRTDGVCESGLESNETKEQSNIWLILLSSMNGGFLLVIILTVIIVCKYRRRMKKGKENSLDQPDATSASQLNNEPAITLDVITAEYSTINHLSVDIKLDATKDEQKTESVEAMDEYLHPVNHNESKRKMAELPDNGYDDCTVVENDENTMEDHYDSGNPYTDLNNAKTDKNDYQKLKRTFE